MPAPLTSLHRVDRTAARGRRRPLTICSPASAPPRPAAIATVTTETRLLSALRPRRLRPPSPPRLLRSQRSRLRALAKNRSGPRPRKRPPLRLTRLRTPSPQRPQRPGSGSRQRRARSARARQASRRRRKLRPRPGLRPRQRSVRGARHGRIRRADKADCDLFSSRVASAREQGKHHTRTMGRRLHNGCVRLHCSLHSYLNTCLWALGVRAVRLRGGVGSASLSSLAPH
jgi:hypothetical protein